jgi:hypothetical protein
VQMHALGTVVRGSGAGVVDTQRVLDLAG